jgi:ribonuclease HII
MLQQGCINFTPFTAGIDEAGRGPLAGPVVAAAVILPKDFLHKDLNDSKKLTRKKREELALIIKEVALSYSIVAVGSKRIDILNIREATKLAMSIAVRKINASHAIIDGNMAINTTIPQTTIVKGDSLYQEIAAASILAKVYRDDIMKILAIKYPGYSLEINAGYPTKKHRAGIFKCGSCRIHRMSFNLLGSKI